MALTTHCALRVADFQERNLTGTSGSMRIMAAHAFNSIAIVAPQACGAHPKNIVSHSSAGEGVRQACLGLIVNNADRMVIRQVLADVGERIQSAPVHGDGDTCRRRISHHRYDLH